MNLYSFLLCMSAVTEKTIIIIPKSESGQFFEYTETIVGMPPYKVCDGKIKLPECNVAMAEATEKGKVTVYAVGDKE